MFPFLEGLLKNLSPSTAMRNTGFFCLIAYLGISPIQRLPVQDIYTIFQSVTLDMILIYRFPIDLVLVRSLLLTLGILSCSALVLLEKKQLHLPKGIWGLKGLFILLIFSWSGILQAQSTSDSIMYVQNILIGFVLAWCLFNLEIAGYKTQAIFTRSVVIIFILSIFVIINNYINSSTLNHHVNAWLNRTAWSHTVASYLPILLFLLVHKFSKRPFYWKQFACIALFWGIFFCQVIINSRGGVLASCVTLLFATFISPLSKWMRFILVTGCIIISVSASSNFLRYHTNLDTFSTFRIKGYLLALNKIRERPFFGHGIEKVYYKIHPGKPYERNVAIHNMWLKWGVEHGILVPLFFLLMITSLFVGSKKSLFKKYKQYGHREQMHATSGLMLIIVSILISSMLEPSFIFGQYTGNFSWSALWWVAVGTLLSKILKSNDIITIHFPSK